MLEDVLKRYGLKEVTAMEVYTDMFKLGEGCIQTSTEKPGEYKSNPIGYWKDDDKEKGHWRIFFEDTFEEILKELQEADFALINGLSYFGRRRDQEHASKMYAMIFDIDGVTDSTLNNFLNASYEVDAYPLPNYIILSGHGIHLYYIFEEPIPLFPNIKIQLKELKYALTNKMWNMYTSVEKNKQYQSINQAFRVVGGKTKKDATEPLVRAFSVNQHPYSLSQLNEYVPADKRIDEKKLFKESKMTLEQAKKKYPEWYQKVVIGGDRNPKKWDIAGKVHGDNPYALYDWWKRQIYNGTTYGHRYFAIMCLAIYAIKCDVPEEKLREDALELMPYLNSLNPENPFTEEDIESALECYDSRYYKFPRDSIEHVSGITLPKNKRNGRKQEKHLMGARVIRDINCNNWREGNGRPKGSGTAENKVKKWRINHPNGTKAECNRDTKLDPKTIRKWWQS